MAPSLTVNRREVRLTNLQTNSLAGRGADQAGFNPLLYPGGPLPAASPGQPAPGGAALSPGHSWRRLLPEEYPRRRPLLVDHLSRKPPGGKGNPLRGGGKTWRPWSGWGTRPAWKLHPWLFLPKPPGAPGLLRFSTWIPMENSTFDQVRQVAQAIRDTLEALGLKSYPKLSGATGIQNLTSR